MPALGGYGLIFEVVQTSAKAARAEWIVLDGHPRDGWTVVRRRTFRMSAAQYRRFAANADGEFAHAGQGRPAGEDVMIVCMDGPGYRTERVRGAELSALYGFCPLGPTEPHPNVRIVCAVQKVIDARLPGEEVPLASPERCSRRGT